MDNEILPQSLQQNFSYALYSENGHHCFTVHRNQQKYDPRITNECPFSLKKSFYMQLFIDRKFVKMWGENFA